MRMARRMRCCAARARHLPPRESGFRGTLCGIRPGCTGRLRRYFTPRPSRSAARERFTPTSTWSHERGSASPAPVLASNPAVGDRSGLRAATILLYGRASGVSHWRFLLVNVTDGAIGLPAIVLFVTVRPTDVDVGLAQVLRSPSRLMLGALGGPRLVALLVGNWRSLEFGRRARGIADSGRWMLVALSFALALAVVGTSVLTGHGNFLAGA